MRIKSVLPAISALANSTVAAVADQGNSLIFEGHTISARAPAPAHLSDSLDEVVSGWIYL